MVNLSLSTEEGTWPTHSRALCASPLVQHSKELCKMNPHHSLSQTLHDLTLETGLDETPERSWLPFSFVKENQTRIPQISLTVGC